MIKQCWILSLRHVLLLLPNIWDLTKLAYLQTYAALINVWQRQLVYHNLLRINLNEWQVLRHFDKALSSLKHYKVSVVSAKITFCLINCNSVLPDICWLAGGLFELLTCWFFQNFSISRNLMSLDQKSFWSLVTMLSSAAVPGPAVKGG